jgi:hypothetical protein
MRTSIAKSLQVRCKAIRTAVDSYNSAALAMDPPRPTVDWTKVSHYNFLEEFVLLQDTRNDVRNKDWARPEIRATIKLYRRVQRAREEIIRLNVETRRLHTAILDESMLFDAALQSLPALDPSRGAIADFATRRRRINAELLRRIQQIYSLPGFTGICGPGIRLGSGASAPTVPIEMPTSLELDDNDIDDSDVAALNQAADDEAQDRVGVMLEYIGDLATLA